GAALYESLHLPVHRLSALLTEGERTHARDVAQSVPADDIATFRWDGLNVGEHALAGALRFYARGTLDGESSEAVLRRYLEAGLLTAHASRRLFAQERFEAACFNHGIYIPHGVIGEVARSAAAARGQC